MDRAGGLVTSPSLAELNIEATRRHFMVTYLVTPKLILLIPGYLK